ncbi:hypothetical protein BJ138DRAFT_1164222 [Hygrophoropsis aurantiaca]|uniref:Uncharacterized protein n=1 Tax=Hygrophoropsis aurantiaca TaxID=72124 RepID=A0ACB7ZYJ8_9AGAM|nr:hypothetical protein BJ138DRAFT_1164222 [Hygrophoropsis aurantiaca]
MMHRALLIEDIQHCIFNWISSKKTLSALSRTCEAFTESALDAQWRDLDSFTRLIECMPHDLWSRDLEYDETAEVQHSIFTLRRPILSSDWAVFQKYSHRVRSVIGPYTLPSGASLVQMDDPCILSFCSLSAPIPLLPNLTVLDWSLHSNVGILALLHLVSPCLTSLTASMPPNLRLSSEFQSATPISIDQIRPSLKHFAVDGDNCYSVNLLNGVARETIMLLAQLPTLRHATFNIPADFATYIEALPSPSPTQKQQFSKLRRLYITHENLASMAAFLNCFDFHLVEEIGLSPENPSSSLTMGTQEFFTALASSLSPSSIRNMAIYDQFRASPRVLAARHPLGIHELRPLLQFRRLQALFLTIPYLIVFDDALLLEMADAWPHLTTLCLNRRGLWSSGSRITPLTFIELLERCPELEALSIPLDFSAIDCVDFDPLGIGALRNQDRKRAKLKELCLGPYMVIHPQAIARFLAAVLPDASDIHMLASKSGKPDAPACRQSMLQINQTYLDICHGRGRGDI